MSNDLRRRPNFLFAAVLVFLPSHAMGLPTRFHPSHSFVLFEPVVPRDAPEALFPLPTA